MTKDHVTTTATETLDEAAPGKLFITHLGVTVAVGDRLGLYRDARSRLPRRS